MVIPPEVILLYCIVLAILHMKLKIALSVKKNVLEFLWGLHLICRLLLVRWPSLLC